MNVYKHIHNITRFVSFLITVRLFKLVLRQLLSSCKYIVSYRIAERFLSYCTVLFISRLPDKL